MAKIYIENYGCSANRSNAEIMAGLLERAGCIVLIDEKEAKNADIVIINTCIVKGPTESHAVKRIKELQKTKPQKPLIISGCMPEAEQELLREIAPDAILVGPQHIKDIVKAVDIMMNKKKRKDFLGERHEIKLCLPKHRYNKVIDIVQVSEGCDGDCTYCLTRFAKGHLYSYPPEKVIEEVSAALKEGCKEIWLTSQDCASYEHGLPDLLHDVAQLRGKFFVRAGMMNPNKVLPMLDELIEAFKEENIFKFIHIPVQSGNDEILKKMNRRYKAGDFRQIVKRFREEIPEITISTDIICGFPTETEEQFNDSLKLIQEIRPDVLNISRFWPRPGTAAEKMKQHASWLIKERSRKLTEVFNRIALEKNRKWLGWKGKVLIDEKGKAGTETMIGRNYCYKPVVVRAAVNFKNNIFQKTPPQWRLDGQIPSEFVLRTTPEGASPGSSSATVACDEAGVGPSGLSSRTHELCECGRRTATRGANAKCKNILSPSRQQSEKDKEKIRLGDFAYVKIEQVTKHDLRA